MLRLLFIGFAFLASGFSFADTDADIRVNRIEMTEVAPDDTSGDNKQSEATDYNSSRSNKADNAQQDDDDSDVKADADKASDDDADDAATTDATDHNSSRSRH